MHDLRQALSALVMTRSRHPRFEGMLPRIDCVGSAKNPYCGDAVSITITLDATGGGLAAVRCCVEGCALCKASADLMAECLQGKTRQEAAQLDVDFHQLLSTGTSRFWAADHPLQGLCAFAALHGVPARSACAVLPWQALRQALSPTGDVRL
jgi:nitrogen fixation NifU-like protein